MWNDVTSPIMDDGLESARRYLVGKKGLDNAHTIFHDGNLQAVRNQQMPYHLYVVGHGCSDRAAMASDPHVNGKPDVWSPETLARILVAKSLPGNVEGRIKLILCHSAETLPQLDDPVQSGKFAQLLARALHALGSAPHTFADVYVGGFVVPVHWYHMQHLNKGNQTEIATRVYYRCDAAGTLVTREEGLRPKMQTVPYEGWKRVFGGKQIPTPRTDGAKWLDRRPAMSGQAVKYCYFPFDYLPRPKNWQL